MPRAILGFGTADDDMAGRGAETMAVTGDDQANQGRNTGVERLMLGFSNLRETREQRPMVLTGGDGVFVIDEDGRRFLDASASFYCAALGYSNERLVAAAHKQMQAMPFYVSAQQRTVPAVIELAERMAAMSPVKDAHVAFGATGSEANEFALKFMRYRNM